MVSRGRAARAGDAEDRRGPQVESKPLKSVALQPINFIADIPNCLYGSIIARLDQDKSRLLTRESRRDRRKGTSSHGERMIISLPIPM